MRHAFFLFAMETIRGPSCECGQHCEVGTPQSPISNHKTGRAHASQPHIPSLNGTSYSIRSDWLVRPRLTVLPTLATRTQFEFVFDSYTDLRWLAERKSASQFILLRQIWHQFTEHGGMEGSVGLKGKSQPRKWDWLTQ